MGFQRLTPIHSLHEDDPELSEPIDAFVLGLGEWIDELQDAHAESAFGAVAERATTEGTRAEQLGYPVLRDAAEAVAAAASETDEKASRKAIGDLIEIVQRIRLGHRSAA